VTAAQAVCGWVQVRLSSTLRQHVDVRRMLRDGSFVLHGSSEHTSSHLACWLTMDATISVNASYDANSPCLPVSVYPSSQPSHRCSLSTSITLPMVPTRSSPSSTCPTRHRFSTSNTAPSLLELVSSGQNSRNDLGLATYRSRSISPSCVVDVLRSTPGALTSYAYFLTSGMTSG
jgi:hypothetical protein